MAIDNNMKRSIIIFSISILCVGLSLVGCGGRIAAITDAMKFLNSTIRFPESMIAVEDGKLTTAKFPVNTPVLVKYYGPEDCAECSLSHVKDNVALAALSKKGNPFELVIIMAPPDEYRGTVIEKLSIMKSPLCIFIDSNYYFESLGVIPKHEKLHTFLLNKEGKPVFLGDPSKDHKSMAQFESELNDL